jgi:hypothetical protein
VALTQIIGLNWYVIGRIGETRLAYRDFVSPDVIDLNRSPARTDRLLRRGVGIGRRLGDDIRVGFDVDYVRRRSNVAQQEYEGYKFGGSISYGLQTR